MTKREKRVYDFIRSKRKQLLIQDWDIAFKIIPIVEYMALGDPEIVVDSDACAFIKRYDRSITIYLKLESPEETDEANVLHELCHIYTYNLVSFMDDVAEHIANTDLREFFKTKLVQEIELSTCYITRALSNESD